MRNVSPHLREEVKDAATGRRGPCGVPEGWTGHVAGPTDTTAGAGEQALARTPDNSSPLRGPSGLRCPWCPTLSTSHQWVPQTCIQALF